MPNLSIESNEELIREFITDMLIIPRKNAHKWSKKTNQTPNLKLGYPAQHLASLITGIQGTATGARGNDLADGSEVKACSKVDQSDKCKSCSKSVLRQNKKCPSCGSTDIKRNNDSKWLISIRNEDELRMAIDETPRFIFIVTDYPLFNNEDYETIRIRVFEIWVKSKRSVKFIELLTNYYNYIYKYHIEKDPSKTPAPKNIFPDSFPFYMCNPVKVFECIIEDSLGDNPKINITHYIKLNEENCEMIESELMPKNLLSKEEKEILKNNGVDIEKDISEEDRKYLSLRDTDKKPKEIGKKKTKIE